MEKLKTFLLDRGLAEKTADKQSTVLFETPCINCQTIHEILLGFLLTIYLTSYFAHYMHPCKLTKFRYLHTCIPAYYLILDNLMIALISACISTWLHVKEGALRLNTKGMSLLACFNFEHQNGSIAVLLLGLSQTIGLVTTWWLHSCIQP